MVLSGFDFPAMVKSRRFQAWNRVRGDLLLAEIGIVSEWQSFSVYLNRVPPPIRFSDGGANPRIGLARDLHPLADTHAERTTNKELASC